MSNNITRFRCWKCSKYFDTTREYKYDKCPFCLAI